MTKVLETLANLEFGQSIRASVKIPRGNGYLETTFDGNYLKQQDDKVAFLYSSKENPDLLQIITFENFCS